MATPMPTAAKAIAAVCFAILGWITANLYVQNLPDSEAVGTFREWVAVLGAIIGWRVMGPSVGRGYVEAAGSGIKTVVVLVVVSLVVFSVYEMLGRSTRSHFDDVGEASIAVLTTMYERSQFLLSFGLIVTMVIGGSIAGMLAENAGRRWR